MEILSKEEFDKAHVTINTYTKAEYIKEARKIGFDVRYSGKKKMFYVGRIDGFKSGGINSISELKKVHITSKSLYGNFTLWTTDFVKTDLFFINK